MIRIITISLILLTLHSCTPTRVLNEFTRPSLREPSKKEARQQARHERRGQRKLTRLLRSHPELQRIDTIMAAISIITPERRGTITQPFLIPVYHTITQIPNPKSEIPNPKSPIEITFSDSLITARITITDGTAELDYSLHPRPEKGIAAIPCPTIQPTQYIPHPLSWWQRLWIGSGKIAWIILIIIITTRIITKKLNTW